MLKLDFFEKEYSLKEIIDAYIDGSIDNFKGDTSLVIKDFIYRLLNIDKSFIKISLFFWHIS